MLRNIIEYGAYNTTLWFALFLAFCLICGRIPEERWGSWRPLAIAMAFGTALNLSVGLYRAYVAPRDLMQDIVSAHEYRAGRSMYPDDLQECMQRTLAAEEQRRNLPLGETVQHYGNQSNQSTLHQHWVQAHPPVMTAFVALAVGRLGVLGTQISFAVLSLLSWGFSIWMITRELRPDWGEWRTVAVVAASLGASPLITSFRNGQSDLLLGAMAIACWALARHHRCNSAGVLLGLAISLKLIPAVLLVIFLVRWPRAFLLALAAYAITTGAVLASAINGDFQRYLKTAGGVVEEYAAYPSNISLLGLLVREGDLFGLSVAEIKPVWLGLGAIIAIGLMVLARKGANEERQTDLLFGLSLGLIPLCSPVAWDHYLAFLLLPLALAVVPAKGLPGTPNRLVAMVILLWCIPETAWLNLFDWTREHDAPDFAVWFLEPLRTYALLVLAGWFAWSLVQIRRPLPLKIDQSSERGVSTP